jgi:hypothetical protein
VDTGELSGISGKISDHFCDATNIILFPKSGDSLIGSPVLAKSPKVGTYRFALPNFMDLKRQKQKKAPKARGCGLQLPIMPLPAEALSNLNILTGEGPVNLSGYVLFFPRIGEKSQGYRPPLPETCGHERTASHRCIAPCLVGSFMPLSYLKQGLQEI